MAFLNAFAYFLNVTTTLWPKVSAYIIIQFLRETFDCFHQVYSY